MIHIFHGEQIEASRQELTTLRAKFTANEAIVLNGKTVSITDLLQATQSDSLFGGRRLVIVENLLSQRFGKKSAEQAAFSQTISQIPAETEVVFWEDKEIGKTILGLYSKQADVALFKPDRHIFAFVESIRPGSFPITKTLFHKCLQRESAEFVFSMLIRQFRYLIMVKELGNHLTELSPWQATKLAKQAQSFSQPQLLSLYEQLLQIDVTMKSGTGAFTLAEEIELFLTKI